MNCSGYPWLWPYGESRAGFDQALHANGLEGGQTGGWVANSLNRLRESLPHTVPLFEPSTDNLGALEYERRVGANVIPTRDLSHDWYNGLVWLAFSRAKREINGRHIEDERQADISDGNAKATSSNGRSRLRDALTLFDESGALLLATKPSSAEALLNHDWPTFFSGGAQMQAQEKRLLVFGHGLLDSLHLPHKGLCAKVIPIHVKNLDMSFDTLDSLLVQVVQRITDPGNFSPLPVMGIAEWFSQASSPGFYDDKTVFREKPTRKVSSSHKRLAFEWDGHTLTSGKCVGQSLPVIQGEESPDSSEHSAG